MAVSKDKISDPFLLGVDTPTTTTKKQKQPAIKEEVVSDDPFLLGVKKKDELQPELKVQPLPVVKLPFNFLNNYLGLPQNTFPSTSQLSALPSTEPAVPGISLEQQEKVDKENNQGRLSDEMKKSANQFTFDYTDHTPDILKDYEQKLKFDINSPHSVDIENANPFKKVQIEEERKSFDRGVYTSMVEMATNPVKIGEYNASRVKDINAQIEGSKNRVKEFSAVTNDHSSLRPSRDIEGANAVIDEENKRIAELELEKNKLKVSAFSTAMVGVLDKHLFNQNKDKPGFSYTAIARELTAISDPEREWARKSAEELGKGLPEGEGDLLEKLGIDFVRMYAKSLPESDEAKFYIEAAEKADLEFIERNVGYGKEIVREKLASYLHKEKGKSGVFGYSDETLLNALKDPKLGLSEAEKKIAEIYVIPEESNMPLFGTAIGGSGFFRSGGEATEKYITNTKNWFADKLNMRGDEERNFEKLNSVYNESRYNKPGEGPLLNMEYAELINKGFSRPLTEDEEKKKEQISSYLNVRNFWDRTKDLTGDLTAQVLMMALTTKGIGGAGKVLSKIGASGGLITGGVTTGTVGAALQNNIVGLYLSSYLNAEDNYKAQALGLFPGKENAEKRKEYSRTMSFFEGFSEGIFNDTKILKAFTKIASPTVADITSKLLSREITQQMAARELGSALTNYLKDFRKEFGGAIFKESTEEAVVDFFQGAAESYYGGGDFDLYKTGKQALKTFLTTAQGSGVIGGLAAHGASKRKASESAFYKSGILDMGKNPLSYLKSIEGLRIEGEITEEEANEKRGLVNKASQYFSELPQSFDSPKSSVYILHRLNEDILSSKMLAQSGDPILQESKNEKIREDMARSNEIRRLLVNGKLDVTPDMQEVTDDKKMATDLNVLHTNDATQDDLIGTKFDNTDDGIKKDESPLTEDESFIKELLVAGGIPKSDAAMLQDENGEFDKTKVPEYLKFVAEQAVIDGKEEDMTVRGSYAPAIIELAKQKNPDVVAPSINTSDVIQESAKEDVGVMVAELESKRDNKILSIGKPEVKLEFIAAKELVDSKDPIGNKKIHDDIKDRYKKTRELIECLWAKK